MATVARYTIKATDQTQRATRSVQRGMSNAERSINRASKALTKFQSLLGAVGIGFSLAAATRALTGFARKAIEVNDAAQKLGDTMGASARDIRQLTLAAELGGSNITEIETAIANVTRAVARAENPLSKQAKLLRALGLEPEELARLSPAELFETVGEAVNAVEDPTARLAVALELLGRRGAGALRAIGAMDEALQTMIENNDLAAESVVQLSESIQDEFTKLSSAAVGFGNTLIEIFGDDLVASLDSLRGFLNEMRETLEAADALVTRISGDDDGLGALVSDVGSASFSALRGNPAIAPLALALDAIRASGEEQTTVLKDIRDQR